ncbi:MAG: hypothetical protein LBC53_07325 [Spirochaetaceae bacterium]|jgi:hypothetical protein|nr:hypothetical protein [Spirochaetaceae bacterium]
MTNKTTRKFTALILTAAVFIFPSCNETEPEPELELETRSFWAVNFTTGEYYKTQAELLVEGAHCKVWVEKSTTNGLEAAQKTADAYDNRIYQKILDAFDGVGKVSTEKGVAGNIMEFADYLADSDKKLTILLLDIIDGYKGTNDSYTGGYFSYSDIMGGKNYPNSNLTDMIYIDTYPNEPGSESSNKTLAHEMQHLMNFTTSWVKRLYGNTIYALDLWIDEGLSSAAEYVYMGSKGSDRLWWFNNDMEGTIARGNNFYVWGNNTGKDNSILDEYATVYMFFQWLRIQKEAEIYKKIIVSRQYDYKAVENAFNAGAGTTMQWEDILKSWFAANYFNNATGLYGYKGEPDFKEIKTNFAPVGPTIKLLPEEGVYSAVVNGDKNISAYTSGSGANIKYAGLSGNAISGITATAGGALLTFNSNTTSRFQTEAEVNATLETGNLTNETPAEPEKNSLFSITQTPAGAGPFRIDARDILARNTSGSTALHPKNASVSGALTIDAGRLLYNVKTEEQNEK